MRLLLRQQLKRAVTQTDLARNLHLAIDTVKSIESRRLALPVRLQKKISAMTGLFWDREKQRWIVYETEVDFRPGGKIRRTSRPPNDDDVEDYQKLLEKYPIADRDRDALKERIDALFKLLPQSCQRQAFFDIQDCLEGLRREFKPKARDSKELDIVFAKTAGRCYLKRDFETVTL